MKINSLSMIMLAMLVWSFGYFCFESGASTTSTLRTCEVVETNHSIVVLHSDNAHIGETK